MAEQETTTTETQATTEGLTAPENPTPQNAPKPVEAEETVTDEIPSGFGFRRTFKYEIDGKLAREYVFQFPGVAEGNELATLSLRGETAKYHDQLLRKLSADPQVRSKGVEWFDTHKGMYEVLAAADKFLGDMLDGVRV